MKKEIIFLIISGIVILSLAGILLYLIKPNITGNVINDREVVHIQEMPVNFTITDKRIIGINIDTDYIGLATVMRGHKSKRMVTIVNPFSFPVDVELSFSEDIKEFVGVDYDSFILGANNDSLKFGVSVNTNETSPLGNYNGIMKVIMKKV